MMNKINTLIVFSMIAVLSSCGQVNQSLNTTETVSPNPGDTESTMTPSSSTIILDDTSKVVEWKAETEITETTDGPL